MAEHKIGVCSLEEMPRMVDSLRPGRLISLLPAIDQPPTPEHIHPSDHLRVLVDDVDYAQRGVSTPAHEHIRQLLGFLRESPLESSLLIHCLAGVSRSPAAALVALVLEAPGRELQAARVLREAAPFVNPNHLIVELADAELKRDGALIAALQAMGEPDMFHEFQGFLLPRSL
jgi:predicted protein tyrosine phosphatase